MIRSICAIAVLPLACGVLTAAAAPARTPDDLPLPADQVMFMAANPGEDIGLPLGATKYYALGRSLQRQGEAEAALLYLRRAYRLAPESGRIARTYAQGLLEAGYVQDAALVLGDLVATDPGDIDQRQQYAQLLAQAGQKRLALEQVQELRRRGERGPALVKLEADLLSELGQLDDAVEVYREAGRRDPDRTEDYILAAALMLQREGRYARMAGLLSEGLQADPVSRTMRVALVRYLVHDGDSRRRASRRPWAMPCAAREATAAARSAPSSSPRSWRGGATTSWRPPCCGMRARRGSATAKPRRSGGASCSRSNASTRPGRSWMRPRVAGRKMPSWRSSVAAPSRWPAIWRPHGVGSRRPSRCSRRWRSTASRCCVTCSCIHGDALAADDPDDAARADQDAARAQARRLGGMVPPEDAGGHLVVGTAWRVLGEYERACRHFELAAEVNESRLAALLELGFCRQLAGDPDGARETLAAAYNEYPDDPEAANSYGYFLAEQGEKLELAERLIEQALAVESGQRRLPRLHGLGLLHAGSVHRGLRFPRRGGEPAGR